MANRLLSMSYQTRSRVAVKKRGQGSAVIPSDWEVLRDFNGGTNGASVLSAPDGFDDNSSGVYSNDIVMGGGLCCKLTAPVGTTADSWGGIIHYPSHAYKGDVVWTALLVHWPVTFDLETARLKTKFIRHATRRYDDSGGEYADLFLEDDGAEADAAFMFYKESIPQPSGQYVIQAGGSWSKMTKGVTHEVVYKLALDNLADSEGGTGHIKIWWDGEYFGKTSLRTLNFATDYARSMYFQTQWNSPGVPYTMSNYVDNIRLAKNGLPSWAASLPGVL